MDETIYALASAPGKSGVAVIRVAGPGAFDSLAALTRLEAPKPRVASLRKIYDPDSGEQIDHALVLGFAGPHSFTGTDVVEYHVHGGHAVMNALSRALDNQPSHRMAEPGEFSRRAFENGRMDLTEAEAVADLVDAETAEQQKQALKQMSGALGRLYDGWRETLVRALAYIEADIDFPDEDLPGGIVAQIRPQLEDVAREINDHLDDNRRGERLRHGLSIAVLGPPNAGKSSLVNALAQRDVAIVSDIAGTTRDVIEIHLDLGGYPVNVADTAGLRPRDMALEDQIEEEGIRRAIVRAREADLKLVLFDAAQGDALDEASIALVDQDAIPVFNKADLAKPPRHSVNGIPAQSLSVETGDGMQALLDRIVTEIKARIGSGGSVTLTRRRHRKALEECRDALSRAIAGELAELAAEDTRMAVRALGRITGRVDVEDLLDVIFRDFCIGK